MRELWDDEQLLDALKASLRARQCVPPGFVQAGRSAYARHRIGAGLARLACDSAGGECEHARVTACALCGVSPGNAGETSCGHPRWDAECSECGAER